MPQDNNLKATISPYRLQNLQDDTEQEQSDDYIPSAIGSNEDVFDGPNTESVSNATQIGMSVNDTPPRIVNNTVTPVLYDTFSQDLISSAAGFSIAQSTPALVATAVTASSSPLSSVAVSFASYVEESSAENSSSNVFRG